MCLCVAPVLPKHRLLFYHLEIMDPLNRCFVKHTESIKWEALDMLWITTAPSARAYKQHRHSRMQPRNPVNNRTARLCFQLHSAAKQRSRASGHEVQHCGDALVKSCINLMFCIPEGLNGSCWLCAVAALTPSKNFCPRIRLLIINY